MGTITNLRFYGKNCPMWELPRFVITRTHEKKYYAALVSKLRIELLKSFIVHINKTSLMDCFHETEGDSFFNNSNVRFFQKRR